MKIRLLVLIVCVLLCIGCKEDSVVTGKISEKELPYHVEIPSDWIMVSEGKLRQSALEGVTLVDNMTFDGAATTPSTEDGILPLISFSTFNFGKIPAQEIPQAVATKDKLLIESYSSSPYQIVINESTYDDDMKFQLTEATVTAPGQPTLKYFYGNYFTEKGAIVLFGVAANPEADWIEKVKNIFSNITISQSLRYQSR